MEYLIIALLLFLIFLQLVAINVSSGNQGFVLKKIDELQKKINN